MLKNHLVAYRALRHQKGYAARNVGGFAWRTARLHPVDALRYE